MKKKKDDQSLTRNESMMSLPAGFLLLILVGAALLMLPFSTAPGKSTSILTALFTSTTSVCVTGSVVVDTCTHWTLFGKIVILCLIQLGGLGIITAVVFLVSVTQRRFSLGDMIMLKDMFELDTTAEIIDFYKKIFFGTLIVEGLGALCYMPVFCPQFGAVRGIWYSFFTSVSAFCNAGITIMDSASLENYSNNPLVLITTMMLIIIGGLGYVVWTDLNDVKTRVKDGSARVRYSLRQISVHTRLVIRLTAAIVLLGGLVILICEYNNPDTLGNMPLWQKILNSIFQSTTARTAGFSSVSQQGLSEATCFFEDFLMFIGGSPLGTAGGVKTVTVFIVIMNLRAFLKDQDDVVILKRRIPAGLIRKATAIITVQLGIVISFTILLLMVMDTNLTDALYETMSAVSTVGLSRGLTSELNWAGQVLIIIAMFIGRIGPISMLLFFQHKKGGKGSVQYADGKYIVG